MAYVELNNITKVYPHAAAPVLGPINRTFDKGQFITLLGPSGCGKSTLLRCISGLLPMTTGRIVVDGEDITAIPPQKRGIGMVFQQYALFPNLTVWENMAFGLQMQRVPVAEQKSRIKEVLGIVEMGDFINRYPHQLSGGQKQRVALGRSLVTQPRILLLDEPLSALDARIRRSLREDLRRIQRELGLTTLFVTHDQKEALTLSDRILLINKGQIEQDATAGTLYSRPSSVFAAQFIGLRNILSPQQARQLFGFQPHHNISIRPESIHILREAHAPEHGIGMADDKPIIGTVTTSTLLGTIVRYHLEVRGQNLFMDTLNRNAEHILPPGTQVPLYFDRDELHEMAH